MIMMKECSANLPGSYGSRRMPNTKELSNLGGFFKTVGGLKVGISSC